MSDFRRFLVAEEAEDDADDIALLLLAAAAAAAADPGVVVALPLPALLPLMPLLMTLLFPGLLELLLAPLLLPPPSPPLSVFMLAQHGSDDNDSHGIAPKLLLEKNSNNGQKEIELNNLKHAIYFIRLNSRERI